MKKEADSKESKPLEERHYGRTSCKNLNGGMKGTEQNITFKKNTYRNIFINNRGTHAPLEVYKLNVDCGNCKEIRVKKDG